MTNSLKKLLFMNTLPLTSKSKMENSMISKLEILPHGINSSIKLTKVDMVFLIMIGIKHQEKQTPSNLAHLPITY